MADNDFEAPAAKKTISQELSRSYWATNDADLQMEADMEKGLFLASSVFLEREIPPEDIYSEVIRALSLAQNFLYKYEQDDKLIDRVDETITDASNGIDLNLLRVEYEALRREILREALRLGFGRQSEPKYPWEYKMAMQSQLPMTPELSGILQKKTSSSSGKSSSALITRYGHRALKNIGTHQSSSRGTTRKGKQPSHST